MARESSWKDMPRVFAFTSMIAFAARSIMSLIFSPASYHLRGAIGFEMQHG
jgi:hypothetical protein